MDTQYTQIIAVDLGTTTTAWATRQKDEAVAHAISPISQNEERQKTPSDIHFFLKDENEKFSVDNSVLGTSIPQKYYNAEYTVHYHFAFYKMALYQYKADKREFMNVTLYPEYPKIKASNSSKEFRLSDVYEVVVQHIKKSIVRYKNDHPFDFEHTVWAITVPAIAHLEQKNFMRQIFKKGMGSLDGKEIRDCNIEIVLEPEGGFLYARHLFYNKFQGKNIAIFDFGGGTYDLVVAKFEENAEPSIVISDFGEAAGGSNVDQNFMMQLKQWLPLEKANAKERSICYFNILNQFQQAKHNLFIADSKLDQIEISLKEAAKFTDLESVSKRIEESQDPEDPEVICQENTIFICSDYVKSSYYFQIQTLLVSKTQELLQKAISDGVQIKSALMLGGFSACDALLKQIEAQCGCEILVFPDPSLAIVKGATFFNRYNIERKIHYGIGLESLKKISDISDEKYKQLAQSQEFDAFKTKVKGQDYTGAGMEVLFQQGTVLKEPTISVTKDLKPANDKEEKMTIFFHSFEENKNVPLVYALDDTILTNPIKPVSHMGFEIPVPHVSFEDKVLTIRFQFCRNGEVINVYYKWKTDARENEKAVCPDVLIPSLSKRFIKNNMKSQNVHCVMMVDQSGSMCAYSKIGDNIRHPKNKLKDALGDIFNEGIYRYIIKRQQVLGEDSVSDKYSITLFNDYLTPLCQLQQLNPPDRVFDFMPASHGGNENFPMALTEGLRQLKLTSPEIIPQLIFLTDGENYNPIPAQLYQDIKNVCKSIYIVGFGNCGKRIHEVAAGFGLQVTSIPDVQNIQQAFVSMTMPEVI